MKKRQIWLLIVILCCLCLWIWLYIGKSNNTSTNKLTEDKFDKQTQCINLYPSIKEYLTDQYTWGEPDKQENYARVNNVEVWYSSLANGCVAYLDRDTMDYRYTAWGEDYYKMTQIESLLDVNYRYNTLAYCEFSAWEWEDCRMDFLTDIAKFKDS